MVHRCQKYLKKSHAQNVDTGGDPESVHLVDVQNAENGSNQTPKHLGKQLSNHANNRVDSQSPTQAPNQTLNQVAFQASTNAAVHPSKHPYMRSNNPNPNHPSSYGKFNIFLEQITVLVNILE